MQKCISILLIMSLLVTSVSCHTLTACAADIDFESAESINPAATYEVTVEGNGDYLLASFTAPEDGYYLFEALGEKYKKSFFSTEYFSMNLLLHFMILIKKNCSMQSMTIMTRHFLKMHLMQK